MEEAGAELVERVMPGSRWERMEYRRLARRSCRVRGCRWAMRMVLALMEKRDGIV